MLTLARADAEQADAANARFLRGDIEDIPLPDGQVDVIISNCVISLSADKPRVIAEAFRVLRPGGRLGISDVIADGGIDPAQPAEPEHRVGCCATLTQPKYRDLLQTAGFTAIAITSTHAAAPDCIPPSSKQPSHPPGTHERCGEGDPRRCEPLDADTLDANTPTIPRLRSAPDPGALPRMQTVLPR